MDFKKRHRLLEACKVYFDSKILSILFLGFVSGLPLALTTATLSIWLVESGVSKTSIGLFAMVGLPYTLKFLWAPLIDRLHIPFFTKIMGRRRSWMILTQIFLGFSILGLGSTHPAIDPFQTALWAFAVAFFSASQDIVIDAFRVDILEKRSYGAGAATVVFGYRVGMMASGAGALYLASAYDWSTVYTVMACLVGVGIITAFLSQEPDISVQIASSQEKVHSFQDWFKEAVFDPFSNFASRNHWALILIFIILFKLGDAFLGTMTNPFLIETGFSKIEIANISKLFGLIATIGGGFLGGIVVSRYGIMKGLFVCGVFQLLSNLIFAVQAYVGYDLNMLIVTIATENITSGMGTAAFVAYLSSLCHASYSATQYALLSSFSSVGRTFLVTSAGWLAEQISWIAFFIVSTFIAVPAMLLLAWLILKTPKPAESNEIT